MDSRLEHYIDIIRDIAAESQPAEHTVRDIAEEAKRFAKLGCDLGPELRRADGKSHGRHLLYGDPCYDFVVTAMAWPAGYQGEPHDHSGGWGVVAVVEGALEIVDYRTPKGPGPLVETGRSIARPGDVAVVLPEERDVHCMKNVAHGMSLSIHVYSQVIDRCRAFDPVTGQARVVEPKWTTEFAGAS